MIPLGRSSSKIEKKAGSLPKLCLACLICAYAAAYGAMSWLKFTTFHSGLDMSYYLRLIWGLGHGRFDLPLVGAQNVLGLHLEPILLPFAALSALGVPLAPLLLISQSIAVALLAVPAFRLAARHLGGFWQGLLGAVLALLYPTVTVATLHDFHPVTLALPLLLGVVDALDDKKPRRALVLGGLALLCREDIALQLAILALAQAPGLSPGTRRALLLLAAGLVSYFSLYTFFIQAAFVPCGGSYNLHFANLGGQDIHSGRDLALAALADPLALLQRLATWDRFLYVPLLFLPMGLLGLLSPRFALGALPIAAINLLSDFPRVRTIEAHYATAIAPFVIGASFVGAGKVLGWLRKRKTPLFAFGRAGLFCVLCVSSVGTHVFYGGSPLAVHSFKWRTLNLSQPQNAAEMQAALESVPSYASVSAHPGLLAHLAQRPRALWLPDYGDGHPVDIVLTLKARD
jgi:uncharacterized membrane protein